MVGPFFEEGGAEILGFFQLRWPLSLLSTNSTLCLKEPTNGGFGTSISSYSRSDNGVRGSGLRRSLSQLVQEAEKDSFKFPKDDVLSNEIEDSPVHKQPAISLQSLYGPPGGSNR